VTIYVTFLRLRWDQTLTTKKAIPVPHLFCLTLRCKRPWIIPPRLLRVRQDSCPENQFFSGCCSFLREGTCKLSEFKAHHWLVLYTLISRLTIEFIILLSRLILLRHCSESLPSRLQVHYLFIFSEIYSKLALRGLLTLLVLV
jgi:hypothetical protein